MKKPKITMNIIKEDVGYSGIAHVGKDLIATQGDTLDELRFNIIEATNLYGEEKRQVWTIEEIAFHYDLTSFFAFYSVINAKALSQRIGMNQSLLSQYINGVKRPSAAQTKRILEGVQNIGRELAEARFVM
jgi:hypothetical protein